jgi:hypothetical protein
MKPIQIVIVALTLAITSLVASQAQAFNLKDDEKCEAGGDCKCVNVTCKTGCKCEITVGVGICTDCPIPEIPTSILTIPLSAETNQQVKMVAEEERGTSEGVVLEALREYLERREARRSPDYKSFTERCEKKCQEVLSTSANCAGRCSLICGAEY